VSSLTRADKFSRLSIVRTLTRHYDDDVTTEAIDRTLALVRGVGEA
jgi:hypothetical protein